MWEEIACGHTDGRTQIDKLLYRLVTTSMSVSLKQVARRYVVIRLDAINMDKFFMKYIVFYFSFLVPSLCK